MAFEHVNAYSSICVGASVCERWKSHPLKHGSKRLGFTTLAQLSMRLASERHRCHPWRVVPAHRQLRWIPGWKPAICAAQKTGPRLRMNCQKGCISPLLCVRRWDICPALASIPCARCQEAIAGVYRLTRAAVARYLLPWTETLISHRSAGTGKVDDAAADRTPLTF